MVTRKEVAARAGVSVAAVSRVVNNSGYVRYDKRQAVEQAIQELGYRPKLAPMVKGEKKTRQIMFCMNGIDDFYALELYKGVSDYAARENYVATMGNAICNELLSQMDIDGLILSNEIFAAQFADDIRHALSIPVVYASFGAGIRPPRQLSSVEADTYHAMEVAVECLIKRGHTRIAMATPFLIDEYNPRCVAWRNMMLPILGASVDAYAFISDEKERTFVHQGPDGFFQLGLNLADRIALSRVPVTAVACFNDILAVGVLHRFHELGIRVPEDISLMGIDASSVGKMTYPSISSVSLSPFIHGQECARILFGLIRGENVSRKINIPIRLRLTQSIKRIE